MVGEGPEIPACEDLAAELGIKERVKFLGKELQVERILQASDLFMLPSATESFGLAALEAMACGCPVMAYAVGGLPEVVEDGVSGLLCHDGVNECMGTLAADLLLDEERYQAMRRQHALEPKPLAWSPRWTAMRLFWANWWADSPLRFASIGVSA